MTAEVDSEPISNSTYAIKQEQLNALMDQIRSSGVESNLNISLVSSRNLSLVRDKLTVFLCQPQIAVIGNQSAGKSSLIEGISGVSEDDLLLLKGLAD